MSKLITKNVSNTKYIAKMMQRNWQQIFEKPADKVSKKVSLCVQFYLVSARLINLQKKKKKLIVYIQFISNS